MGFLDKAKASFKELENDLNNLTKELRLDKKEIQELQQDRDIVNKQVNSLSLGKSETTVSSSSTTSAPSTAVPTPASSVAPTVKSIKMGPKLPLAVRKEMRDTWETKVPELQEQLTSLLGVPWTVDVDMAEIFTYCKDKNQIENPGRIMCQYVEKAIANIKAYLEKFGEDGKAELNKVASAHTITIAEDEKTTYSGCAIVQGSLRILFGKTQYGTNIDRATEPNILTKAINTAGTAAGGGESAPALDFNARTGIKNDYDPKAAGVADRLKTIFGLPSMTLVPNFEANYALLSAVPTAAVRDLPREWQRLMGAHALQYFEGLAKTSEGLGFAGDDMMQEAFAEAVEKNEIQIQVVDKLAKGTYHEVVIEDGVLYIRTIAKYYTANFNTVGQGLVNLL